MVATVGYNQGFVVLWCCFARVVVDTIRSAYRQDQVLGYYKKTTSARKTGGFGAIFDATTQVFSYVTGRR